jgi:predicted NBD/HSP70 family sugar kinase
VREQHVVDLLQAEGPMSRADIARRFGISKPTAASLVRRLLQLGLLHELGTQRDGPGRPGRLLALNPTVGSVAAFDVGGTLTRGILTDLRGDMLASLRGPTPQSDAAGTVAHIAEFAAQLLARSPSNAALVHVALATPGVLDDRSQRIRFAPNIPALEAPDFVAQIRAALLAPITFLNDVKAATLGELRRGAGIPYRDLVYAGIGTGLGFGLAFQRQLFHGVAGRAGEFGLTPLPGTAGTVEDRVSGVALRRAHLAAGGSGMPEDAFAEAAAGRAPGALVIEAFLRDLTWAIAAIATLVDPECVVLGGGVGMQCGPYLARIEAGVRDACGFTPHIRVTELGDDAGLIGAVSVALEAARTVDQWSEGGRMETQN